MAKVWTPEDIEALRAGRAAGRSLLSIANELERTVRACESKSRDLGFSAPRGTPFAAWTDGEVAELRRRVGLGESSGVIAEALGRTRNMIIGKCNRARIKLVSIVWRPHKYVKSPRRLVARAASVRPNQSRTQNFAQAFASRPVSILELEDHHCRWVASTSSQIGRSALFCAQTKARGGSYCDDHAARVYR